MSTHGDQPVMRYCASRRNSLAMSAITRCQSTIGSAAAPTKPDGADPPRPAAACALRVGSQARHGPIMDPGRPPPPAPRPPVATWFSVMAGKNGSATERAATSSQTGNSPSRWPKRSR